jgi:diguanylate cyclase (GGDEF)-like protein/PAS domain S-box-containing protein
VKAALHSPLNLKSAILVPLGLVLTLLTAGFVDTYLKQQKADITQQIRATFASAQRAFDSSVASHTAMFTTALELVTRDSTLRHAVMSRDREAILERATPIFALLHEQYGVTDFRFIAPDRSRLLQLQQPERPGDGVSGPLLRQAESSGKPASGLELEAPGLLTIKVVVPWYAGEHLIGYVELGEDAAHLFTQAHEISRVDLYVTLARHAAQADGRSMPVAYRAGDEPATVAFQTTPTLAAPVRKLLAEQADPLQAPRALAYDNRFFQALTVPLQDAGRHEIGSMLLLQDITERIRQSQRDVLLTCGLALALGSALFGFFFMLTGWAEKRLAVSQSALLESRERFRSLVESSSDWIWEVDVHGTYTYASPKVRDLLGYAPEEVIGRTPFDLMPPQEAERVSAQFNKILALHQPIDAFENVNRHKDGRLLVLETSAVPVFDSSGTLVGYRGMDRDVTARKQAETALRQSEAGLAEAQRIANFGSWDWDIARGGLRWTDEIYRIFGESPQRFQPSYEAFLNAVHPDDRARVERAVKASLEQREAYAVEHRIVRPDGSERIVQEKGEVTFADDGTPLRMVGTVHDVTERKASEQRLRQAASVFENTSEGVIICDPNMRIVAVNKAFTRITGYEEDEARGQSPKLLRSGRHEPEYYRRMGDSIRNSGRWQGEIWNRRKDGTDYPEWLNISAVRDEAGAIVNYIGVFSDITSIKESRDRLEYTAHHDALTGLPNRLLFRDRMEQAIATARRSGASVALLFVDLDRFKVVNDTLGHEAGDQLLQVVARRLSACVREEDTVARMGGDEFVVIQKDVGQPEDAALLATRILATVATPFSLAGHEIVTGLSIGISLYPQDGQGVGDLLKNADTAMYRAKEKGRHGYQYYSSEMATLGLERLELESDLRQALQRAELEVHYQPQVDLASGRIVGAEALARWQHPTRGTVAPAVFIPLAEDIGMIGAIGEWVLNTACADAKAWQEAGLPAVRMAVNVSGRQIGTDHVAELVRAALRRSALAPQFLEIEVTESVLMEDAARAISTLNALKEMGVALAIDDFGTGYSSLSYLKRFPVDKLKIDKSFVDGLENDRDDTAIALAVIAMAHSLRHTVIAEGVESEAQLAFLRAHGCDEGQGYLFSPPVPAQQFAALLGNATPLTAPAEAASA